jgi:HTH-type transcriptional regulator/antitoxin HipB
MFLRTPIDIGAAVRDRRRELRLDQSELAKQVGVSRKWIIDAEGGKPRAGIGLVLRTLNVLGLRLSLEPDAPLPSDSQTPVPIADMDEVLERLRGNRNGC